MKTFDKLTIEKRLKAMTNTDKEIVQSLLNQIAERILREDLDKDEIVKILKTAIVSKD